MAVLAARVLSVAVAATVTSSVSCQVPTDASVLDETPIGVS